MFYKVIVALSMLGLVSVVSAHAELAASSIEDGSSLTAAPSEITLTFTEAVEAGFSTFKLYPLDLAAEGAPHAEAEENAEHGHDEAESEESQHEAATTHGDAGGHAELDVAAEALVPQVIGLEGDEAQIALSTQPETGRSETVTLTLQDELEPGAYVVMWRVLSGDSHPVEGFLSFTYAPG